MNISISKERNEEKLVGCIKMETNMADFFFYLLIFNMYVQ